jgi:hypothetical protein
MTTQRRHLTLVLAGLLAACGGGTSAGSGNSGSGSGVSGIDVPKEISALPTTSSEGGATNALVIRRTSALAADAGTDYSEAQTFKFVDEQALAQFSIFNTIFKALGQTHYADAENVNAGPYGAMVDWEDKGGSSTGKQLIPWVVDSKMTTDASGKTVNQVKVWMEMDMGDGQMHLVKVALDIYEAPTQRADGSYADYGVWNINAKFDENATGYFAASCTRDASGHSVILLHERDPNKGGGPGSGPPAQFQETKGILNRSDASGYGVIDFPDENSCHSPDCQPEQTTVAYAYNASHVGLQSDSDPVVYKDRTSAVDVVNRYGLYDATTGEDVTKSHSFGFPIKYVDDAGVQHWGY